VLLQKKTQLKNSIYITAIIIYYHAGLHTEDVRRQGRPRMWIDPGAGDAKKGHGYHRGTNPRGDL